MLDSFFTPLKESHWYAMDKDLNLRLSLSDEQSDLFAPASFPVISSVLYDWFHDPGTFSVDLDPEGENLHLVIEGITDGEGFAILSAPIADIVKNSIRVYNRQAQMAALLRKLADEIEQGDK